MLINGVPGETIDIHDRGLQYGDGVFRTLRIEGGQPLNWARHYRKLRQDCAALGLDCPADGLLAGELQQLTADRPQGVAKIIVTRGRGERGYAPSAAPHPTRILTLHSAPAFPQANYTEGIVLRVCELRLSQQPRLAGIKHLNRLENVLAVAEWQDPEIAEGLLLDQHDNVIEGTRSNLFLVRDGTLYTPDLSRCGVAGIQRDRVIEWAVKHAVGCRIEHLALQDVLDADEVFLVNSVIGLWPVRALQQRNWTHHPLAQRIGEYLVQETTD